MAADDALMLALLRHGVPFVVIGGHAVNVHGYQRVTEDVDVVWLRSPESELALFNALTEVQAQYIGNEIDPATGIERAYPVSPSFIKATRLMMLWTRHGFLDLFDYVPSFPDEDPKQLLIDSTDVAGIRYVGLEWLRKMKQAAGRSKDLLDLDNLPK